MTIITVGIWNPTIQNLVFLDIKRSSFLKDQAISMAPTIWKPGIIQIWIFFVWISSVFLAIWHPIQLGSEIRPFEIRIFWRLDFKWSSFSYGYSPNHSKTGPFKIFVQISNGLWQNGGHVSGFQIMGLPDFRSLLKSRPLSTQLLLDHLKSRLGQISDPHCIWFSNGWASRFQT